jgi:hypothetical protein
MVKPASFHFHVLLFLHSSAMHHLYSSGSDFESTHGFLISAGEKWGEAVQSECLIGVVGKHSSDDAGTEHYF